MQGTDVSVLQTVLNTDIEREALLAEERAINASMGTMTKMKTVLNI